MDHITFLTLTVAYCKQTAKKCVNVKVGGSVHKLYMNYPENNLGTIHRAFRHCLIAWGLNETRNRGLVFFQSVDPQSGYAKRVSLPAFFQSG